MKCPICGNELRPSKKDPAYGLCDNCKKKFKLTKKENSSEAPKKKKRPVDDMPTAKSTPHTSKKKVDDFFDEEEEPRKKGGLLKFFLVFIVLIAIAGAAYYFFVMKADEEVVVEETPTETQVMEAIDSVEPAAISYAETHNDITVTLAKTSESTGSELATPSEGNIFYICEFEITNNSASDITINSLSCIEAFCGDYSVSEDIAGLLLPETDGLNSLDGTVAAGQTFAGVVTYQIPADYANMQFRVTPDFWNGESATFMITNE